jgi:hypothetical protein
MEQKNNAAKPPKRIRLGSLPYLIGIGGKKESNDIKLMFIEKGIDKRQTISIINDPANEKVVFDIHTTDQAKKAKAIASGVSPYDAYESIIKMSFDIKQLTQDESKIERDFKELAMRCIKELENSDIAKDFTIVPLSQNGLLKEHTGAKEMIIDDKKLLELTKTMHSIEDLERTDCDKAMIRDDKGLREVVFKKNGRWYYCDFSAFMKEVLNLLKPYIDIEIGGKEAKEEFFETIRKD